MRVQVLAVMKLVVFNLKDSTDMSQHKANRNIGLEASSIVGKTGYSSVDIHTMVIGVQLAVNAIALVL